MRCDRNGDERSLDTRRRQCCVSTLVADDIIRYGSQTIVTMLYR